MSKALYTEADLRALAPGSVVRLGPGDLVTPAAMDVVHERGLRLDRGQSLGAPGHATKRDCLWHKMLAEPGKYLVEVRGGEAVVWLLDEQGPVAYGRDRLENHS
ncbi:MAG: hypothetical protein P1V81_02785 [Planctomycetota bacterium]|nr:hypothetical protein [Planctomycetota bacterium]